MDKRTKKRKNTESFSLESLEKRFMAKQAFRNELSANMAFLRGIEISRMEQVEEEEALVILSSKITFQGVIFLKTAIQHIPKTFVMKCSDYGGASLRSVLIYEMVSASQTSLSSLSKEEIDCYVNFLESSCPNFIASSPLPDEQLWNMSEGGKYCFTKFLAPPVSRCLCCDGNVTMHNPPSKAKVFTLQGPIPATKITLECRPCKMSYGIARYTNDRGSHYYSKELSLDLIEVSNTTYLSGQLYKWLPSLRQVGEFIFLHKMSPNHSLLSLLFCYSNHSWVSFSGFSESYNEVYQEEIERYRKTMKG